VGLPVVHRWLVPITGAAFALYAWYVAHASFEVDGRLAFSLFDDAMISMRYARNLAHGQGLRWNAGAAPVEGYTNLLWTLWMALLQLLPLPQRLVSLPVSLTSAALLCGNLWLVRGLVVGAGGRAPSAVYAVVFSAVCYPLIFWSLRGLEVGLLAFLIDAAILLAWHAEDAPRLRQQWPLALVLSAMVLVRDDALVPACVVLGFLATDARTRTAFKVSSIAVLGALLGHLFFRLAYYGAPLPNTYYLKLVGIPLQARLWRGLVTALRTSAAELLLPLVLMGFAVVTRPRHRRLWLLVAVVLGQLGLTLFVGGDAWEAWGQPDRFLSIALPAVTVGAVLGAEVLLAGRQRPGLSMVFALALAWRAYAVAARDFVPTSFTVTPPVDLHHGLGGLASPSRCLLAGAIAIAALAFALRPPRRAATWQSIAVGLVVTLATVGANWRDFFRNENTGSQILWDSYTAAFGIRLGDALPPNATIAVVAAGAVPFFSNLPAVDLLGKSDPHIAREEPLERFIPGHDKRDYAYSLSTYQPDVVLELWHHAPDELQAIAALDYRKLPNGMYVRASCPDDLLKRIEDLPEYRFRLRR
jgi:hypothetical protein